MYYGLSFLLFLALLNDIVVLGNQIHRNITGRGASGIPGIPWLIYALYSLLYAPGWKQKMLWVAGFTLYHLLCYYLLPTLHRRLLSTSR